MKKKSVEFNAKNNLDPKFIANCVQVACGFNSSIFIKTSDKTINAKSLMGMMNFDFENIKNFNIEVNGDDEEKAFSEVVKLFE